MKIETEPESDATNLTTDQIKGSQLTALWRQLADEIPSETKDQIGKLYIQYGLGLGREVAEKFADPRRINDIYHRVGMIQSALTNTPENIRSFWENTRGLAPKIVPTDEDLLFLIEKGRAEGPFFLVMHLHWGQDAFDWKHNPSEVLRNILTNAHVYK